LRRPTDGLNQLGEFSRFKCSLLGSIGVSARSVILKQHVANFIRNSNNVGGKKEIRRLSRNRRRNVANDAVEFCTSIAALRDVEHPILLPALVPN
jgi:hypothetical protein